MKYRLEPFHVLAWAFLCFSSSLYMFWLEWRVKAPRGYLPIMKWEETNWYFKVTVRLP